MGGGVGVANWELLLVRPVRLNTLFYFFYTHFTVIVIIIIEQNGNILKFCYIFFASVLWCYTKRPTVSLILYFFFWCLTLLSVISIGIAGHARR